MNLTQDRNPGGHKEDRASFANQIQYNVSIIHPLERRGRKNREEGERHQGEDGRLLWTQAKGEREGEREWLRKYLSPLTLEQKD